MRIKGRLWDADARKWLHIGYYDTPEERDVAVAQAKLERSQGRVPRAIEDRARGGELFVTFAERTLLHRRRTNNITANTWANYNRNLQKWLIPSFGQMKLREISARHVDRWFNEVLPEGSPSNAQRYAVLSLVMRRAVLLEEIDRSPCVVEGVSANKSKKRPTLSLSDFQVLVEASANDQERALLWLLMGSGARIGELLALSWDDVDLRFGEVTISKHIVDGVIQEGTKSHADQVRYLTLPRQAVDALLAHQESSGGFGEDPVFTNARGGRMRYDSAATIFNSIRSARGLEVYRMHDIRHASLTAYAKTASMAEVMARGGHSDYRTALRYQHHSRQRDREIVKAMEDAL